MRLAPAIVLASLLAADARAAVYLEIRGSSTLTIEELLDAVAARVELARERGADVLLVTVVLEAEHAVLVADGRVVRVGLEGRSGSAAARVVAIGVTDLVTRLPTVPAPHQPRAAIAVWPAFLLGLGTREQHALGLAVDGSLPLGPARLALTLELDRGFSVDGDGRSFALLSAVARVAAGVRLGRFELRAGPLVAVVHASGGHGDTSLAAGGGASAQLAIPLDGALALVFTAGVDAYARRVRYLELGQPVLETPRVQPWAGVGLAWGWGR